MPHFWLQIKLCNKCHDFSSTFRRLRMLTWFPKTYYNLNKYVTIMKLSFQLSTAMSAVLLGWIFILNKCSYILQSAKAAGSLGFEVAQQSIQLYVLTAWMQRLNREQIRVITCVRVCESLYCMLLYIKQRLKRWLRLEACWWLHNESERSWWRYGWLCLLSGWSEYLSMLMPGRLPVSAVVFTSHSLKGGKDSVTVCICDSTHFCVYKLFLSSLKLSNLLFFKLFFPFMITVGMCVSVVLPS